MTDIDGVVRFERRGTVGMITFDRPHARNALTRSMYDQLASSIARLDREEGLRVAVLRGSGGSFIAGTDIGHFADFSSPDDGIAYERRLDEIVEALETARVPTVAAVEGHAVGGGLVIAAACDLRLCTPDARFGVPIARTLGNCLSVRNHARLVAHLGPARTKALLLTAEALDAQEARAAGFVLHVVEREDFDSRIGALCDMLASHAPITIRVTREAVRRIVAAPSLEGDDLIRDAYGSRDFHEGVTSFMEKRAPNWEGR